MAGDSASRGGLVLELSASQVEVVPGGAPVELIVTVVNGGRVVEQATVDVVGLDPDWFTHATRSIALFPGDSERLTISLHVPRQAE